jgi:Fic-DOC domain mobile mystery protein B
MVMTPPKDSLLYTPKGATPIEPDDLQYLLLPLSNKDELNAVEQANIFNAKIVARASRKMKQNLLSIGALTELHQWMFSDVWKWAGEFRTRVTNIGVDPHQIREQLAALISDGKYQMEHKTYSLEEVAVRFHHRMVKIHLFPNGNGRHSRLVADLLMFYNGKPEFNWGGKSIDIEGTARNKYLAALGKADGNKYDDLMEFALASNC